MLRQILIVHSSEEVTTTIHRIINANISDAAVFTAESVELAAETVKMFNINLILLSPAVSNENLLDVYHKIEPLGAGKSIPLLLLTAGEDLAEYATAFEAGVNGHLELPCEPTELCRTIDRICCPQRLRGTKRYSIPRTEVHLSQANCQLSGRVVNISEGGMLCQFDDPVGFDWLQSSGLSLTFNMDEGQTIIAGIEGVPVNLNVMRSHADYSPAQIRVAFRFVELSQMAREQLGDIFASYNLEQRLLALAS